LYTFSGRPGITIKCKKQGDVSNAIAPVLEH